MSTVTTKKQYTPEDLLTMPDGNRYELVDGHLEERAVATWSSYVGGEIHSILRDFCRANRRGWVFPEGASYQCFPDAPKKVRRPDVSFIGLERLSPEQAMEEGHLHVVPDAVVEVLSPKDLAYKVDRKIREYRKVGVRLVWVVNPDTRRVKVYRADGTLTELGEDDEITGEDVVPGFRCPIREFFRLPTGARPAS